MKDKINLYEKKREKEIEEEINFLKELLEIKRYKPLYYFYTQKEVVNEPGLQSKLKNALIIYRTVILNSI